MKRQDYISWDEYFMGVAVLAARRSKDPNTQVGACIVSPENIIISTGYNGFPVGCSDDEYPWEREGRADEVSVCGACGAECDFERPWPRAAGRAYLCGAVSL